MDYQHGPHAYKRLCLACAKEYGLGPVAEKFKVMREGRWWQVWDTEQQQCKGQFWSKEAATVHATELAAGRDCYREALCQ